MSKRTSVLLEEDVYKKLVEESLKRYGTVKALSKVLNELLRVDKRTR
jgi:predicted CopG family antitoxin